MARAGIDPIRWLHTCDGFEGMILQKLAEATHEQQKEQDEWMAQEIANRVGKTLFG